MPNNNLTDLENAIYNSIPRLKELSSGCEVEIYKNKYQLICKDKDWYDVKCLKQEKTFSFGPKTPITILGHPILLNDVLEWMKELLGGENHYKYRLKRMELLDNWNLPKPALKDQNQELIDALCELIPK